jgi:hypothetical protein
MSILSIGWTGEASTELSESDGEMYSVRHDHRNRRRDMIARGHIRTYAGKRHFPEALSRRLTARLQRLPERLKTSRKIQGTRQEIGPPRSKANLTVAERRSPPHRHCARSVMYRPEGPPLTEDSESPYMLLRIRQSITPCQKAEEYAFQRPRKKVLP